MKKYILILSVLTLTTFISNAQMKKADKKFANLEYIDAIKIYKKVIKKGNTSVDLYRKIADSYYYNADYREAVKWYKKLFELDGDQPSEYAFRYGQSLKSIGNYKKSTAYIAHFFEENGEVYSGDEDFFSDLNEKTPRFSIEKFAFNTKYSDYPGYFRDGNLYVISTGKDKKKTPWNDEPTSDILLLEDANLSQPQGKINTMYNEGSLVITKNDSVMYFTRNDYTNKKLGKDSNKTTRLKLYKASKPTSRWIDIVELPFNNSEYSIGHPTLSIDESKLYFVSDMEGGKGGTDIYEVDIYEDGSFGTPKNMEGINTPADEQFPFVDAKGDFYFSSDGHPNLGGLDVFLARKQGDSYMIHNLGKPINSDFDDFAFVIDNNRGYFSSNREGTSSDDIYQFSELELLDESCLQEVTGVVKEETTGALLPGALVELKDKNGEVLQKVIADSYARFNFELDCNSNYTIIGSKVNYKPDNETIVTNADVGLVLDLSLNLTPKEIEDEFVNVRDQIMININPIYFDLDKDFIRPDAAIELEKVVKTMNKYPTLKIAMGSHTDSRSSSDYNMDLSQRRANSTRDWIIKRGISPSRLTRAIGYGETQLINHCYDGIKCSEAEHQLNRRTEFVVVNPEVIK